MTPALRQDMILRCLRRSGFVTVSALAQAVGASRRTVLRDLGRLRDQGFLIHSESGRGGGLRLDPASVHTGAPLSVTEVFALILGVAALRAARQLPFADLADAGLAKIERALPAHKVRDLRLLLDCRFVGQLSPQQDLSDLGQMDQALLPCFETAFVERQILRFVYRDARGTVSTREVEPQALLILPPLWYLVAWDPARGDFRLSAWTASAGRRSWPVRRSGGDGCRSRPMSAPMARGRSRQRGMARARPGPQDARPGARRACGRRGARRDCGRRGARRDCGRRGARRARGP